jgi:hypothetical protein
MLFPGVLMPETFPGNQECLWLIFIIYHQGSNISENLVFQYPNQADIDKG